MKRAALAGLIASLVACDPPSAPEPTSNNTQPATARAEVAAPEKAPAEKAPAVSLPGTPHDEEHTRVTLKWSAPGGDINLPAAPGETPRGETVKLEKGQQVEIGDSVVLVVKANDVTAKPGAKLFGASRFVEPDADPEEGADLDIAPGKIVSILKYAGEGTCVLRYEGKMYYAGCPEDEKFDGDVAAKPEHTWWIQPKGSNGWLRVDDRFEVDVQQGDGD